MPAEVEAKFLAGGPEPLDALAEATELAGATLGPARVVDETDRYLDTDDGRLAAARWACRLRSRGDDTIVSMKGPMAGDGPAGGMHRRPELEGPATSSLDPGAWAPSEARALLERLSGGHPLREVLRLEQRRTERAVATDGRHLGTLTLDRVGVMGNGHEAAVLHVVELELVGGDAARLAHLERLGAALAGMPGLEPDPHTKLEHAMARLAR